MIARDGRVPGGRRLTELGDRIGLFEALYTTRALRRLKPDPLPEELLFQVVDAAIRAPSGQNAQDWRFIVITDVATKEQIKSWAADAWARYERSYVEHPEAMASLPRTQRLSLQSVAHLVRHLDEAPAIIAVCGLRDRHSSPGGSAYPAVQNLLLAARALGLAASIFNLALGHPQELMEMLGIPNTNQVYCLIPLGYPVDRHGPVRRKPVGRVAYWNRWEHPWPFALQQPDDGWQAKWVDKPARSRQTPPRAE